MTVQVETWNCYGCHNDFNSDTDTSSYTSPRGELCAECHGVCADCSKDFNLNSGSSHANVGNGDVCYSCTSEYYISCNDCGDWAHNDDSYSAGYTRVCERCYDRNYYYCDDCDCTYHNDENHDCNPSSEYVRGYHNRPELVFYHTDQEFDNAKLIPRQSEGIVMRGYRQIAYMGFEIEVEAGDSTTYRRGAELLSECDQIYMNEDSSIRCGFEIISHPMTLDWAMANFDFDQFKTLETMGFSAWEEDTTGIHVHVSRDGFISNAHQMRFAYFITSNEEFLSWLAGRGSCHYSKYDKRQLRRMTKHKLLGREGTERYLAVNLNNFHTIEVRIFQSSLKPQRIKMSLQLIDAVVKYTEQLSTHDIMLEHGLSHDNFIKWIRLNAERYPDLATYASDWVNALEFEKQHGYKARIGE